jgi:hypothetical protein
LFIDAGEVRNRVSRFPAEAPTPLLMSKSLHLGVWPTEQHSSALDFSLLRSPLHGEIAISNSALPPALLFKINENQLVLEAAIMEMMLWVEHRGSDEIGGNVRETCKLSTKTNSSTK